MRPTVYIFSMYQCLVVPYINPANQALGPKLAMPQGSLAPIDLYWEKLKNASSLKP